jgi:hypothetical protein
MGCETEAAALAVDRPLTKTEGASVARGESEFVYANTLGFAYANQIGAKGVLIDWQADPNFNNEQHLTNTHDWDAFPDYVDALRTETMGFSGQVVLVHGDSHYFKLDKPINLPSGGVLPNFTRVETFGARQTHWVSATIDPSDPNLFEFEPRIVAANVG